MAAFAPRMLQVWTALRVWAALRSLVRAAFGTACVDAAEILGYPVFQGWLRNALIDMYRSAAIRIGLLLALMCAAWMHWQGWAAVPIVCAAAMPIVSAIGNMLIFFIFNFADKDFPARLAAYKKLRGGLTHAQHLQQNLGTTPMPASLRAALRGIVRHHAAILERDKQQQTRVERKLHAW